MTDYSQLDDNAAAAAITLRLTEWDRVTHGAIGLMVREARDRELWKLVKDPTTGQPCRSFTRWLIVCCPHSYSTAHAALADVDALTDIPPADLAEMPSGNMKTLKMLSTAVRKEAEVLEAAKSMRSSEFIAAMNREHPGQHLSVAKPYTIMATPEQRAEIEEAVELALELQDGATPAEVVAGWAIGYKQDMQGMAGTPQFATKVVQ